MANLQDVDKYLVNKPDRQGAADLLGDIRNNSAIYYNIALFIKDIDTNQAGQRAVGYVKYMKMINKTMGIHQTVKTK